MLGLLGLGAATAVYHARRGDRHLALKLFSGSVADDAVAVEAFRHEAAVLATVDHPGLVRVHDVGEVDGRPYLVMDLVDGRDLAVVLRDGPLEPRRVVDLAIEVADALSCAHRAGVLHRDIKPQNVVIGPDDRARLIDFGLATRSASEAEDIVAGTLQYASPEQAGLIGQPVDARSDLYSLGVLLFECVAGRRPFDSPDVGELLRLHATEVPPRLDELRPAVGPGLATIVARLLAKDADDRYQSCRALLHDLRAVRAAPGAALGAATVGAPNDEDDEGTPLIGRADELDALAEHWCAARAGSGRIVALVGPPGSGRSRLLWELRRRVSREGAPVLHTMCDTSGVPLGALRDAITPYVRDLDRIDDRAPAEGEDEVWAAGAADSEQRAEMVRDMARTAGGLLVCLDDADLLDDASRRVLVHLVDDMDDVPLMVVVAGGVALSGIAEHVVALGPLAPIDARALAASRAGAMTVEDAVLDRLATRGGGTPRGVLAYLDAVIDRGILRPSWGTWVIDEDRLGSVALPEDALDLALERLDGLDEPTRRGLDVGAIAGRRFEPDLVAAVLSDGRTPDARAREVGAHDYAAAVRCGVLERDGDRLRFIDDAVRRVLIERLDASTRAALHVRLAEELDRAGHDGHDTRHRIAHHLLEAGAAAEPARTRAACMDAARRALAADAPRDAVELVEAVDRLCEQAPGAAGGCAELDALAGQAYYQADRPHDAHVRLERAARIEDDPIRRARIYTTLAEVHHASWDSLAMAEAAEAGLEAIGRPIPRNRARLVLGSLVRGLVGLMIERSGIGFGTASGERRQRARLETRLLSLAAMALVLDLDFAASGVLGLRALLPAARLGPSEEYVRVQLNVGTVMAALCPRRRPAGYRRAVEAAATLGDHRLEAYATWAVRSARHILGDSDNSTVARDVTRDLRHIQLSDAVTVLGGACARLHLNGYAIDGEALNRLVQGRLATSERVDPSAVIIGTGSAAARGRLADADRGLRTLKDSLTSATGRGVRVIVLVTEAFLAVEAREPGDTLARIDADLAALDVAVRDLHPLQRSIFALLAYGWLDQHLRTAGTDERARDRAAAAIAALARSTARLRWLEAHHRVLAAHLRAVDGDPSGALDQLDEAEPLLRDAANVQARFEAARLRARIHTALGNTDDAATQVGFARALADRHGWPHRAAWIDDEFGRDDSSLARGTGGARATATSGEDALHGARLAAIEAMSRAAARIVDQGELIRVALDHIIRVLNADRAFLFLVDEDELVPGLGRDASGADLPSITDHGSTLVERARTTRAPVVVTGTDEGAALGSRSAVVHGLRSIMVAPLELDGRLLGVVYLDSRVAKNMFTGNDLGILAALSNYVAVALETTRASELATAVRSAERERDVADALRRAAAALGSTLDPAETLERLRVALHDTLPCDRAVVIVRADERDPLDDGTDTEQFDAEAVADGAGSGAGAGRGHVVISGPHDPGTRLPDPGHRLRRLLDADAPVVGSADDAPPDGELDLAGVDSWLAVPLRRRERRIGVVLIGSARPDAYGDPQVGLAAALADHGMTAYENARNFQHIQALSRIDTLTGLDNRRSFFDLAERARSQWSTGGREPDGPCLIGVMVDIDHFKSVNDTYGHHVGDQVIRSVAGRLRSRVGHDDVLGRYGGEEFALVTTAAPGEAAAVGERLRSAVAADPVMTDAGPVEITISVGVGVATTSEAIDVDRVLARADAALYDAKRGGRNRTVVADRDPATPSGPLAP